MDYYHFSIDLWRAFDGDRSDVPSFVWPASVPVLPVELAFGVLAGAGLPGVRSEVLPLLPGSVFVVDADGFVVVDVSPANADVPLIASASAPPAAMSI